MSPHTISTRTTRIRPITDNRHLASGFTTAVSLHSHTRHSRERLVDLPAYVARIPLLAQLFRRELRAYSVRFGVAADFSRGWWYPPLTAAEVLSSEEDQIRTVLGLHPIVSITDHDNIDAGLEVESSYGPAMPVSLEWTMPFEGGLLHVGVHNLPPDSVRDLHARLAVYTESPSARGLVDLLDELNDLRDTLIVLNHPLWDLANVGNAAHATLLLRFLHQHRDRVHALELNGYRSWRENEAVRTLAEETALCAISGGDRHGCAPNALLNLTRASSFAELVREVRVEGVSEIAVMPAYGERLVARKMETAADVVRRAPSDAPGNWMDRVTYEWEGVVRPLSDRWPDGVPVVVRASVRVLQALTSPRAMPFVHLCLPRDETPSFGTDTSFDAPPADTRPREFGAGI